MHIGGECMHVAERVDDLRTCRTVGVGAGRRVGEARVEGVSE